MFVMFGCYIKKIIKKLINWGVNCEEEMREKKMRWVGRKKKGNKKEKRNGEWGIRVWWEKRESGKRKKKKKIEREKTKLVLFVCSLYLVQSVKL
jgi:hypothetical protein